MELDGWDNLMIRRTGNFGGNILGFEDEIFMKMGKSVFSICFLPLFIQ
jgi:tetrahydromethanopterin S-methyltransferase subunit D